MTDFNPDDPRIYSLLRSAIEDALEHAAFKGTWMYPEDVMALTAARETANVLAPAVIEFLDWFFKQVPVTEEETQ